MKYTVLVTPEGQANITYAFTYIHESSPLNAARWVRGLYKQIDSLETFPRRCGVAREQPYFEEEIRQLVYKSYRIIFTIDDDARIVRIVYVRHSARRPVGDPQEDE